jgi:hypothetical protein
MPRFFFAFALPSLARSSLLDQFPEALIVEGGFLSNLDKLTVMHQILNVDGTEYRKWFKRVKLAAGFRSDSEALAAVIDMLVLPPISSLSPRGFFSQTADRSSRIVDVPFYSDSLVSQIEHLAWSYGYVQLTDYLPESWLTTSPRSSFFDTVLYPKELQLVMLRENVWATYSIAAHIYPLPDDNENVLVVDWRRGILLIPRLKVLAMEISSGEVREWLPSEVRVWRPTSESYEVIAHGHLEASNDGLSFYVVVDQRLYICSLDGSAPTRLFQTSLAVRSVDGDIAVVDTGSKNSRMPVFESAKSAGSWPERRITDYYDKVHPGLVVGDNTAQVVTREFRRLCGVHHQEIQEHRVDSARTELLFSICASADPWPLVQEFIRGRPYGREAIEEMVAELF